MMGFALLEYLKVRGHLSRSTRVLDVGSQNLINCTQAGMLEFAGQFKDIPPDVAQEIDRQFYFSTPRAGERTLFAGEYLRLIGIDYQGIDVCPAPHTEIVDLNWQLVPEEWRGQYDLVLNLGTTEHLIDQTNAHAYMHDALKVGGIVLHQPPCIGWPNHGYFTYHPQFYRDLAAANDYEILDIWYSQSSAGPTFDPVIEHRSARDPLGDAISPAEGLQTPYYNLNVVMRKTTDLPFRFKLELATSHAAVDAITGSAYVEGMDIRGMQIRQTTPGEAIRHASAVELVEELRRRQLQPADATRHVSSVDLVDEIRRRQIGPEDAMRHFRAIDILKEVRRRGWRRVQNVFEGPGSR